MVAAFWRERWVGRSALAKHLMATYHILSLSQLDKNKHLDTTVFFYRLSCLAGQPKNVKEIP
jgi:hypothetical protein